MNGLKNENDPKSVVLQRLNEFREYTGMSINTFVDGIGMEYVTVLNQINGSELFATSEDHKRKYPAYARTFFLSEEYAKDVLPVLTEEIKRSCHKD